MYNDNDNDERDQRWVDFYDDEALKLMHGWTGGQTDPLYAIASSGGNYAWVFEDAISNLDRDIGRVKKLGRNKFQLGKGTFTKKEIDELHTIRDALAMALQEAGGTMSEARRPGRRSAATQAPPGPASGFGREVTPADHRARIEWERWAADEQRRLGHEALAHAHDLARAAYEDQLRRLERTGGVRSSEARRYSPPRRPPRRFVDDRLFIGIFPGGISYADRSREEHGDYARCAFLDYGTLTLKFERNCPPELRGEIERHAAGIQARRGEDFEVDAAGHTVVLGGKTLREGRRAPARNRRPRR